MQDEIIDNYPITDEMRAFAPSRRRWPFVSFTEGKAWRTTNFAEWKKGAQAARQAGARKGFRFACKWHKEAGFGIIVRVS